MHVELVHTQGEGAGRRWTAPLGQSLVIGTAPEAHVQLRDPAVAPRHAEVSCSLVGLRVTDLGSPGGTYLDQERLRPNRPELAGPQALLRLGQQVLAVRLATQAAPAPSSVAPPMQAAAGHQAPVAVGGGPPGAGGGRLRELYELVRPLGEGGAGVVYHARHRASGRDVAIKGLHPKVGQDPQSRARFLREGQLRVVHPHVVQVFEAFAEGPHLYLVMELVTGGCVEDLLERQKGGLQVAAALRIGQEAALGLEAIHAAGIIHRDVKPANLLLSADGLTKVGDLGIAKQADQIGGLTATGQGLGTLAYVSPEQASDAKRIGPTADLYSLGATLYHLLAGRPPFETTTLEILVQILDQEPPPLLGLRPDCPAPLATLIHDLLQKDPDARPPEAALVAEELAALRRSAP